MGWSSGSALAEDIYQMVRKYIPKDKRKEISREIIDRFQEEDADDWCGETKLEKDAGINQEDSDYEEV